MSSKVKRRVFLSASLAAAACGTRRAVAEGFRYFTAAEARTIEAICAQLIPADQSPGAREAGVVHYIDLQLATRFRKHRFAYQRAIEQASQMAQAKGGQTFADLAGAQQVEILQELETKERTFFDLILAHTRQGFYGDPRHGGNRGHVSWKMLGLDFPQVRGREHYEVG
jgi:gluconate 2-dehydrogenase gamma chain